MLKANLATVRNQILAVHVMHFKAFDGATGRQHVEHRGRTRAWGHWTLVIHRFTDSRFTIHDWEVTRVTRENGNNLC